MSAVHALIAAAAVVAVAVVCNSFLQRLPDLDAQDASKVIVVTGGTSGLGRALVERLASSGDEVITCGRNMDAIRELEMLPKVTAWSCDVADEVSVAAFAANISQLLGPKVLHAVVNNAGVLRVGDPLLAMRASAFDAPWSVNVRGAWLVTRALWPLLRRGSSPVIVNVGSTTEHFNLAQAFHSTYTMSKIALKAMSQGLRQEVAILHPDARVVHLKVGAHATPLDHDASNAAKRLASHGELFAALADKHEKHIREAFEMVTYASADSFARSVQAILHPSGGIGRLLREYHINVSFLEKLVEWLPLWVMDIVVAKAYS